MDTIHELVSEIEERIDNATRLLDRALKVIELIDDAYAEINRMQESIDEFKDKIK